MYGEPVSNVPTSVTRATCSLRRRTGGLPFTAEPRHVHLGADGLGKQELQRHTLVELEMSSRHHHADPAAAEHLLDLEFPSNDRAGFHGRY
ncbi:MAG: hypothetical protein JW751_10585 [Polyangiaceae bacterium]|nr:hypothetical protein [Polyangiaceae bacterium]